MMGVQLFIIPALASIQYSLRERVISIRHENWTPAFAGATIYSYAFLVKFLRDFTPKSPILRRRYFL
jgi:hypothetical protein